MEMFHYMYADMLTKLHLAPLFYMAMLDKYLETQKKVWTQ